MNTLIPGAPLRSLSPTTNEYQRAQGESRAAKPARVARFTLDAPEHSGTIPGARGDILTPGVALTSNLAVIFTLNQHTGISQSRQGSISLLGTLYLRERHVMRGSSREPKGHVKTHASRANKPYQSKLGPANRPTQRLQKSQTLKSPKHCRCCRSCCQHGGHDARRNGRHGQQRRPVPKLGPFEIGHKSAT